MNESLNGFAPSGAIFAMLSVVAIASGTLVFSTLKRVRPLGGVMR